MNWSGTVKATITEDFDVEADTEDDAIKLAEDEFKAGLSIGNYEIEMVEVDSISPDE